jgi:predicted nucleic acid-binding protein/predicted HTH domain antitoxin
MKSVTIQIPDNLEISDQDLKLCLASALYQEQKVSLGEGAMIAEVSKRCFIENLAKYGVSLFNYDANELLEEIKHA